MSEIECAKDIREICIRLLTRREYSQKELRDKLAMRGYERSQTQCIIDDLAERDLQSDQRFAESYARHRIKKGFGPNKIQLELQQRGVNKIDLNSIVLDLAESWFEILEKVYRKKYSNRKRLTSAERAKRSRFLIQRGFSVDMIMALFSRLSVSSSK